jgi:hypothetical protein
MNAHALNMLIAPVRSFRPPYKVVSFYTKTNGYAEHAARLRTTLLTFDVPHELHEIDLTGRWEEICAVKSRFLRDQWLKSDLPIVWLDADATVERPPVLFASIDADFAVHKWDGWQFGSGTLYFGKSDSAKALLDQWLIRCQADPMTWDQIHLQSAWCDIAAQGRLRTAWLPRAYLQISDAPEIEPAVIKHWQASRSVASKTEAFLDHTEHGIALRKRDIPWRNREETFWIAEGTQHIAPNTGHQFPEGNYVEATIRRLIDGQWPMLEIGSGVGRIASLFKPDEYIGAELNPAALLQARRLLPHHTFRIADAGYQFPDAPTVLIYTVLLHISDAALPTFLAEGVAGRKRVILAEVMDRRWRRDGEPPVFNRSPEDYILAMQDLGFRLTAAEKHPYDRYDKEPWNVGRDSRMTFLRFDAVR